MKNHLVQKAKIQTTEVILKITLGLSGAAVALQIFQLITFWPEAAREALNWVYIATMFIFFLVTWYAYQWLKHSLSQALYLYITAATIAITVMLLSFLVSSNENHLPIVVFGFDIAVFIVGLILGFNSAFRYAFIVTGISIILGIVAGNIYEAVPVIFFAFSITSPSWLVDRLEKNILDGEQKFSLVFQDALDAIIIIEKATGRILNVNRATTKILGYKANDLLGQPLDPLFPDHVPLSPPVFFETLSTQDELFGSQSFVRADSTRCPMDITATNMQWGQQPAILLTLRDITERKKAEEEIQRYRDHLEDLVAERTASLQASNEELDAFARTVAHDLKNPLSTLIGFGELLSSRFDKMTTEQQTYAFNTIAHMGRKMTNIIEELLLLASVRKTDEVLVEPIAMNKIVEEALLRVTNLIEEHHPQITVEKRWPIIVGHAAWIEEIWVNYISNAIKYGGFPEQHIPPALTLGYDLPSLPKPNTAPPHQIRFWVHDNGPGLTVEDQERLFTPFTRLTQIRAKGHGLGLSIVRRIVNKLGGEAGVTSTAGEGSTFYFTLPVDMDLMASLNEGQVPYATNR